MYKIVALSGQAGAGKDSIMQAVLKVAPGLHEIISCTTRPMREEMLEATCFNDWFYGTALQSLDESVVNIGVFNPDGIDALLESPLVEVKVYYVQATDKNRLLRQLNREDNPDVDEILRRFKTDREDFSDLGYEYEVLPNNTMEEFYLAVEKIVSQL